MRRTRTSWLRSWVNSRRAGNKKRPTLVQVESPRILRKAPKFKTAVGWWSKSTAHRLAWALSQIVAVHKDRVDAKTREIWIKRLEGLIGPPVFKTPWDKIKISRIKKQEEDGEDNPEDNPELDILLPLLALVFFKGIADLIERMYLEVGLSIWLILISDAEFPEAPFMKAMEEGLGYADKIPETLKGVLSNMALDNLAGSRTAAEFADKMQKAWAIFMRDRAKFIIDTEWTRAEGAAKLLAKGEGGQDTKTWITQEDGLVCIRCLSNTEEGPIPVDQSFGSGHDAPPAHGRCRCSLQ